MGSELLKSAYAALWYEDQRASTAGPQYRAPTANNRLVLVYMCSIASDNDPRFWQGREAIARYALGRVVPEGDSDADEKARRSIFETVRQATDPLVVWGALERVGKAFPGRSQEYRLPVHNLLERLRTEQAQLGSSASSPWVIRKESLQKTQAPLVPETKHTKKPRVTPTSPERAPHLQPVDNWEAAS